MLTTPKALSILVEKFWADGWQVVRRSITYSNWPIWFNGPQNIHCIGDRANKVVLDIFEEIIQSKSVNVTDWRPRIEHAQIMQLSDLERSGRLGGAYFWLCQGISIYEERLTSYHKRATYTRVCSFYLIFTGQSWYLTFTSEQVICGMQRLDWYDTLLSRFTSEKLSLTVTGSNETQGRICLSHPTTVPLSLHVFCRLC